MATYELQLFEPVLSGSGAIPTLQRIGPARGWRRAIRLEGGFWQGSFYLLGQLADLIGPFYEWLGYHLIERSGGVKTWDGIIYELELEYRGVRRRRSLDDLYNAVQMAYQVDGGVSLKGFSTQAQSIGRYGRREEILTLDNVSSTVAGQRQAVFLARHAWPWARATGIGQAGAPRLDVRACGYVFTANWQFAQAGDGTAHNIEHWISAIVGTEYGLSSDHGGSVSGAGDCQFLKAGNLGTNSQQVTQEYMNDVRAWAKIQELAGFGDSAGDTWRAWVDVERELHYQELDLDPRYFLRDRDLYDSVTARMAVNPYALRPGVVRDMSYPVSRAESGSLLNDARDLLVEEIEVDDSGLISLKIAGDQDMPELITTQRE